MPPFATVTAETEFFTVLDDVLTSDECAGLSNYFQLQPFYRVDSIGMHGHWLLEDSEVLRGPTAGWGHTWDAQFPTDTPIDYVMKAVVSCSDLFARSVGRRTVDWEVFSAFPTVYMAGQGLVWHRDSEDNTGSWVYYAHPEWNAEWGGELYLAHTLDVPREYGVFFHRLRATSGIPPHPWPSHLDNTDANELLMAGGIGSYVMPKPNRLVIVKGGTPHSIAKVRPSAGRHPRMSVGGFFKRKGVPLGEPRTPWTL
jgi:hypothetical protein